MDKLVRAQAGDVTDGLVFCGGGVARIHDIPPAAELMERLVREYDEATGG
jgi:NAD(P)H-dependent flavin oxidoreductase YrpB (nitropropane dioxygenase family)